jgi:hypothetical protein
VSHGFLGKIYRNVSVHTKTNHSKYSNDKVRKNSTVEGGDFCTVRLKYILGNLLLNMLGDIENVARHIPASVGESAEWAAIVNAAEENVASYCKVSIGSQF